MSGKYIKFGTKRDKISSNKEETNLYSRIFAA